MGRLKPLSALFLLLLAFSGCSNGGDQGDVDPVTGETPAATGFVDSGVLRMTRLRSPIETPELSLLLLGRAPETLNPWRDPSDLELLLFPRAIRRNPETLEWEPWMAESWEVGEERRSVVVTIRDGAFWSDGTPVTAADWVSPANRYFTDRALRTPYRDRPELTGLAPRWESLGELRFRISVGHPVDRNTLLFLLYLPPLPSRFLEESGGEPRASQELNELWRLDAGAVTREEITLPPAAGPYEPRSVNPAQNGELAVSLERRRSYRDPRYTAFGAERIVFRFQFGHSGGEAITESGAASDFEESGAFGEADLIYVPSPSPTLSPAEGYERVSVGADMTPALLLFAPALPNAREIRGLAAEAKERFFQAMERPGVVRRDLPSLGSGRILFSSPREGVEGEPPPLGASEGAGEGESLRLFVLDRPLHREYAEGFLGLAERAGIRVDPEYLGEEEIAGALLSSESWDLLLLELRERFDPVVGDPLLGNALPLTGQWRLLASEAPTRSVLSEPLSPTELSELRVGGIEEAELPTLLPRLWAKVVTSPREAERQRARDLLQTLWKQEEPWLYLYDEERLHYTRKSLGNLLFRHLPGAELGTLLPLIYVDAGGVR
ncbi:MAG: ABC transporter substrate-binding protein [Spirochaetaceae bacterium]